MAIALTATMVTAIVLLVDDQRYRAGEHLVAALRRGAPPACRTHLRTRRPRAVFPVLPASLTPTLPCPFPSADNVKHDLATRYAAAIVPHEHYASTPEVALSRAEACVKTTPAPAAVYDMGLDTMLSLQVRPHH